MPIPETIAPSDARSALPKHLKRLEAEAIEIMREVVAEFKRPVMLYSIGKDSQVMLHLARKAFHPAPLPFPLLHIDTTWKFRAMYEFRDAFVERHGLKLLVHRNEKALAEGFNPFDYTSQKYTHGVKTQALLEALALHGFDAAFGGARRDEGKSGAKEGVFSFRDRHGQWEPRRQRPELWSLYNSKVDAGEGMRVFPLSNWTLLREHDDGCASGGGRCRRCVGRWAAAGTRSVPRPALGSSRRASAAPSTSIRPSERELRLTSVSQMRTEITLLS